MRTRVAFFGVIAATCLVCSRTTTEVCATSSTKSHAADGLLQSHSAQGRASQQELYDTLVETDESQELSRTAAAAYSVDDDIFASVHCERKNAVTTDNPVPDRKPVMYVHFHKTAGSSMCCEAHRRERVIKPAVNCNLVEVPRHGGTADSFQLWQPEPHMPWRSTCTSRHDFMQENNFTWSAIERELIYGDFCPDHFTYVTIMRKPINLMKSILRYKPDRKVIDHFPLQRIVQCIQKKQSTCAPEDDQELQNFGKHYWKLFDNLMVRMLGGYDAMTAPPGRVNNTHLLQAKKVLEQFDLVLLLETLAESKSLEAMRRTIGWHMDPGHTDNNHDAAWYGAPIDHSGEPSYENELLAINTFDNALYKLAEQINSERV